MSQSKFRWKRVNTPLALERFYKNILPALRDKARELGYALGSHGSMRRDMDLIAAPWVEDHATPDELARALHLVACGLFHEGNYNWTKKPCGRIATTLVICWSKYDHPKGGVGCIDLSVMPAVFS